MQIKTAKRWFLWHKWTSLICTLFLLMLCLTGLPLIFHEEIDDWLEPGTAVQVPAGSSKMPLDSLAVIASTAHPDLSIRYVFWDRDDAGKVSFDLAPKPDAPVAQSHYVSLNAYTGQALPGPKTDGLMYKILQLHTNMFAGILGKLFLGLMGTLFVIAIISGVMLYGPIMKNYDFGMVRTHKSKRLKWLDRHNLLGIITAAWMLVVGITGIINTLSDVVLGLWQQGQLKEMTAPYAQLPPAEGRLGSLDTALTVACQAAPGMAPTIITYPGTIFSSRHHYAIFMHGASPLTARLLMPALVDAKSDKLTDIRKMPWYVNTLFLSEPLHFGDYGGWPLKIIWAFFDLFTLVVLITGLYLWFARRKAHQQQWERLSA